jgi:hypothetical protein
MRIMTTLKTFIISIKTDSENSLWVYSVAQTLFYIVGEDIKTYMSGSSP